MLRLLEGLSHVVTHASLLPPPDVCSHRATPDMSDARDELASLMSAEILAMN